MRDSRALADADADPAPALGDAAAGARRARARSVDPLPDVHAALTPRHAPLRPRLDRLRRRAHRVVRRHRVGRVPRLAAGSFPLAAVTGTMLVCDAWFDIVTSQSGGEMWEAVARGGASASCRSRRSAGSSSTTPRRSSRRRSTASAATSRRRVVRRFEQLQPMLELRDAELELVQLVARHEVELVDESRAERRGRSPRTASRLPRTRLGSSATSSSSAVDEQRLLPRSAMRPRAPPLAPLLAARLRRGPDGAP